jgi:staphylococcal nuclease domain-containing protein 1
VGELLVDRGLLSVIRHRQGEDRSSDYDSLLAREAKAMAEGKGMFDGKEHPIPRVIDASEVRPPSLLEHIMD